MRDAALWRRVLPSVAAAALGTLLLLPACRRETPAPTADGFAAAMNEGQAHFARRNYAAAAEQFRDALRSAPQSVEARVNLGISLLLLGDGAAEAADVLAPLTAMPSQSPQVDYLYGLALMRSDRPAEAVDPLRRAAERDARETSLLYQYAVALLEAGRSDEAERQLREVMRRDAFHIGAPSRLAALARRRGDADEAAELLRVVGRIRAVLEPVMGQGAAEARDDAGTNRYTQPLAPPPRVGPDARGGQARFTRKSDAWPDDGPVGAVAWVTLDVEGAPRATVGRRADGAWAAFGAAAAQPLFEAAPRPGAPWRILTADYDNDGRQDLLAIGPAGLTLLQQRAGGRFVDVTAEAGLGELVALDAAWVDIEHDGDLDLVVAAGERGVLLLRNADGAFTDETLLAGFPAPEAGERVTRVAGGELDDDDAIDVVLAGEPARVLRNAGLGWFGDPLLPPQRLGDSAAALAVNDVNNDGALETVIAVRESGGWRLRFTDERIQPIDAGSQSIDDVLLVDYDNDGYLDVAAASVDGVRVWRNLGADGWRDMTDPLGLAAVRPQPSPWRRLATFDVNDDGAPDLLIFGEHPPLVLRNALVEKNASIRLVLSGTRSNASGIGSRVDLRSGERRIFRNIDAPHVLIGVGPVHTVDTLLLVWSNGVTDAREKLAVAAAHTIIEPMVMVGSCPYLYAWDGERFRFVTDILGSSPLGLMLRPGLVVPADVDEIVALGDERLFKPQQTPAGPRLVVEVTSELREVLYLEGARLLALDAPVGVELHPTDKVMPPPFPPSEVWAIGNVRTAERAARDDGTDATEVLSREDGRRIGPRVLRRGQLRGLAELHELTLDFGPLDTTRPLVLVLSGWLQWGDASVNVGAAQIASLGNPFPRLAARAADGPWQDVDVIVGAPAGKTKTILVDLAGRLPAGTRELRISSEIEIYWDRIALGERTEDPRTTPLDAAAAELRFRGVSRTEKPSRDAPLVPVYDDLLERPPWRTIPYGWCTRYGDVLPLLAPGDGRMVVANCGDAVRIEFDPQGLPPLPPGWRREYFLFSVGWDKDSDHHVRTGDRVAPLPRLEMDDQIYGTPEYDEPRDEWIYEFNTRWVAPEVESLPWRDSTRPH